MKLVPEFEEFIEGLGIPGSVAIVLLSVLVPVAGRVVKFGINNSVANLKLF